MQIRLTSSERDLGAGYEDAAVGRCSTLLATHAWPGKVLYGKKCVGAVRSTVIVGDRRAKVAHTGQLAAPPAVPTPSARRRKS